MGARERLRGAGLKLVPEPRCPLLVSAGGRRLRSCRLGGILTLVYAALAPGPVPNHRARGLCAEEARMATQAPDGLTVEVDVHAVVEAAAVLYAIGEVSAITAGGDTDLTDLVERTASELLGGAGAPSLDERTFGTNPLVVAAHARSYELIAAQTDRLIEYAAERASMARRIREQGNAFPDLEGETRGR